MTGAGWRPRSRYRTDLVIKKTGQRLGHVQYRSRYNGWWVWRWGEGLVGVAPDRDSAKDLLLGVIAARRGRVFEGVIKLHPRLAQGAETL